MKRAALCCTAAALVAVSAGCSSGSSDLTKKGQQALQPYIIQLRSAAAGNDAGAVRQAVNKLEAEVHSQHTKHHISAGRAADIDDAATELLHDFLAAAQPRTSPSETSTSPTPSSETPFSESETPTETATVTPRHTRTVTVSPPQLHPGGSLSGSATSTSSSGQ